MAKSKNDKAAEALAAKIKVAVELGFDDAAAWSEAQLDKLIAMNKDSAEVEAYKEQNAALNAEITLRDKASDAGQPVVEHKGKTYSLPIEKMTLTGKLKKELGVDSISRDDVHGSAEIRKALLNAGSGFMVELEEEEEA